jgi:hypothetical protein
LPAPSASTAPQPNDNRDLSGEIRRFIEQYDGGECFFVTPVAISSRAAVLEGLGPSTAPFGALDKAFSDRWGFEASIGVRLVTQPQCPAITFLGAVRSGYARAPRITLNAIKLRSGETLTGMVENVNGRNIELLLVSETGDVRNISDQLKPGTDAFSFALTLQRADRPANENTPQLVMALATSKPLDSLHPTGAARSDRFFVKAFTEAQAGTTPISAAIRYIQLEK